VFNIGGRQTGPQKAVLGVGTRGGCPLPQLGGSGILALENFAKFYMPNRAFCGIFNSSTEWVHFAVLNIILITDVEAFLNQLSY